MKNYMLMSMMVFLGTYSDCSLSQSFDAISMDDKETVNLEVVEVDKSERRALKRAQRQFERQHRKTVKRIHKILNKYSDSELYYMLNTYNLRVGSILRTLPDFDYKLNNINRSSQEIRAILVEYTTAEFKEKLKMQMEQEIIKSGSAKNFLKLAKKNRAFNKCLMTKIAAWAAVAPGLAFTLGGAAVLGFTPYFVAELFLVGASAITVGFIGLSWSIRVLSSEYSCKFVKP